MGNGSYMLAELVGARSKFPDAELFLWLSPSQKTQNQGGQWIRRVVHLPSDVFTPGYFFNIDMVFIYADYQVCWVDLLKGVLVCNLVDYTQPKFTYVPLPMGQSLEFDGRRRPRSKLIRNMGCFCGAIEFAALVGYKESCPGENIMLKTWTLSSDLKDWKKGTEQRVGDLWDSRSFIERRLPRVTPSSPVISIDEPNVVYVILNEIDHVGVVNFGVRGVNMVHKAQYVLRLDTLRNKVLSHSKVILDKLTPRFPNLFATSAFSAHLQSSKNLQVGLEASEAEVSRKQIKHRSEAEGSRKRKNY